ncbi:hypothetical protein BY996DRAFT_6411716 [Phakopsora pachyrhizi]|uniref:Expressed protein n=1 Tax=Phakopsora pachyrhizi TaxID=170000 RepID=A0AAV0B1U0_PHAPC|nr:hypothetical protein BY996DRAFT_6411716 [Phakopsora pachyrhizi]CAH7675498.1 expressed protein [Phakopsora pachyrhizi]CAH7690352.1 expressed protein [Phakopsora pachyrhizi]
MMKFFSIAFFSAIIALAVASGDQKDEVSAKTFVGSNGGIGFGNGGRYHGGYGGGASWGVGGSLPNFDRFYNEYYSLIPSFQRVHVTLESSQIDAVAATRLIGSLQNDFYSKVNSLGARCAGAQQLSLERKRQLIAVLLQILTQFQSSLRVCYRRWPNQIGNFKYSLARLGEAFKISFSLIQNLGFQPNEILGRLNLDIFSQFDLNLNSFAHSSGFVSGIGY